MDRLGTSRGRILIGALFSLLYLGLLCATSWPTVFPEGREARLAGPDSYFHLRQSEAVLENYPYVLRFDPMTNFPAGEHGLNQGGFDLGVATLSKLSFGLLSPKIILVWISPLCAIVALLWCAAWLSRQAGDRTAGLFLLFSLAYPASLSAVASLGQGDHHAFELLCAVAIAWSLAWLFRPSTSWKLAPLAALPLLGLYFCWAGAPLQLLLVGGVFYFRAWNPEISDEKLAHKGALFALTMLVVVHGMNALVPWSTIWGTSYQLFELGGALLLFGYPVLIAIGKRAHRFPLLGAVGTLVLAFTVALQHPTTRTYLYLLAEERSSAISEHLPISVPLLNAWYGPLWGVALLGLLLLAWRRRLWWASLPLVYAGGLMLFWLQTRDFVYYTPPAIAAAAAYALSGWRSTKAVMSIAVVVAMLPLIPATNIVKPWLEPHQAQEAMLVTDGLEHASAWLRGVQATETEKAAYGLVAPWDLGNILAQTSDTPVGWSQTLSERLAQILYSNHPDVVYQELTQGSKPFRYIYLPARNLAEKYISELEVAGVPIGAEFTIERETQWKGQKIGILRTLPRHDEALLNRLYWQLGENLGHFRLVYETPEQSLHTQKLYPATGGIELHSLPVSPDEVASLQPLLRQPNTPAETSRGLMVKPRLAPEVRIFEVVPGAVVTGRAPAGTDVVAQLRLHSPASQRSWRCRWSTKAANDGKFQLRLPYPTESSISQIPGTIEVHGKYELLIGKKVLTFSLEESMIRNGSSLKVEDGIVP